MSPVHPTSRAPGARGEVPPHAALGGRLARRGVRRRPRFIRLSRGMALAAGLLAAGSTAGCHGGATPAAPVPVVVDTASAADSSLAPEPSTIALTFRIPRDRLTQVLDSLAPRAQTAKDAWTYSGRAGVRYAWARHDLRVAFRGDTILLATDVDYQLQACYRMTSARCWPRVGCGWADSAFRPPALAGHVAVRTRVRLDPAWRIVTETRHSGEGFTYAEADRCRLSVARIDATPYVADYVRTAMDSIGLRFDAWVAQEADFRTRAAELWARAQQPFDLGNGAWLVVAPRAAFVEPMRIDSAGALRTSVAIEALPYVVVGARPELPVTAAPLPSLRAQDVPDSLHLALPIHADFGALDSLLAASFVGQTVESDGRQYTVLAITAAPAGRQVRITADVEGFFKGRLVLTGTPTFDPATNRLAMPDLDYTLATKNLLAKLGNALRHGAFRERLREQTAWELGPQIDTARTRLDAWLNRTVAPGVRTRGAVAQLRFRGIRIADDRVHVLLVADGVATVELAAAPAGPPR